MVQAQNDRVTVVVGVGPGLGSSVAQRFARDGHAVALLARGDDKLTPVQKAIEAEGARALSVPCDATDPAAVEAAFRQVRETLGAPQVLVYNAGAFQMAGLLEVEPEAFEQAFRVNCFGAFLTARQVLPAMVERGAGTVIFTGATASLRGSARFAGLAVGKFGLRALSQSMAREFGPKGVHVAHVIIDGQILTPRARVTFANRGEDTFLHPDAIAESYLQLHRQDRTAWTLEMDLRPAVEKF